MYETRKPRVSDGHVRFETLKSNRFELAGDGSLKILGIAPASDLRVTDDYATFDYDRSRKTLKVVPQDDASPVVSFVYDSGAWWSKVAQFGKRVVGCDATSLTPLQLIRLMNGKAVTNHPNEALPLSLDNEPAWIRGKIVPVGHEVGPVQLCAEGETVVGRALKFKSSVQIKTQIVDHFLVRRERKPLFHSNRPLELVDLRSGVARMFVFCDQSWVEIDLEHVTLNVVNSNGFHLSLACTAISAIALILLAR